MKKVTFVLLLIAVFSNVAKADFSPAADNVAVSGYCVGVTMSLHRILEKIHDNNGDQASLAVSNKINGIYNLFFTQFQKELQSNWVNEKVGAESMDAGINLVMTKGPSDPTVKQDLAECIKTAKDFGLVK